MATMYTQKRTYRSVQNSTYTYTDFPGVAVLSKYDMDLDVVTGTDSQTRTSNKDWKLKVMKHQDASSAYKRVENSCVVRLATCMTKTVISPTRTIYGSNAIRWLGTVRTQFPESVDAVADDRAIKNLRQKLVNQTGSNKAMQPLFENVLDLRTTVRGMTDLTTNLMGDLIRIKATRGRSALKWASKAWLTWGFGISPMMSDAKGLCSSIQDFLERTDHTTRLSSSASSRTVNGGKQTNTGAYGAMLYCHSTVVHDVSYRYTGGFNFNVESANDYGAAQHFNLTLGALVPTAWELMPFSWVADYFGTIGNFLEDVFIASPGNLVYLTRARKYRATGTNILSHKANPGTTILFQHPCSNTWEYFEFERTPLSTLPVRSLRFASRDETGLNGVTKLLNLVSVAAGGIPTVARR